jgi:hypothetical protein
MIIDSKVDILAQLIMWQVHSSAYLIFIGANSFKHFFIRHDSSVDKTVLTIQEYRKKIQEIIKEKNGIED